MTDEVNTTDTPAATGETTASGATFTQVQLDAIISERLAKERDRMQRRIAEQYGDPELLKQKAAKFDELEAAQLSEVDKLRKELEAERAERDKAIAQAKQAELRTLRLRVGQAQGLPVALAERLTGDDEESIAADARAVLASLQELGKPTSPDIDATKGTGNTGRSMRLTPGQEVAARAASMTNEEYIKSLQKMEEARGKA